MREAFARAKSELGEDAVVVDVRKVPGKGLAGLLRPEFVITVTTPERGPGPLGLDFVVEGQPASPAVPSALEDELFAALKHLVLHEVNPSLARELVLNAYRGTHPRFEAPGSGAPIGSPESHFGRSSPGFLERLAVEIGSRFGAAKPVRVSARPTRVLFVGPPGAGKTTSLVKVAALLKETVRTAVITADAKRAGSTFQLRIYGDCLGFPVYTALSPRELGGLVQNMGEYDAVLIDTPGCSHRDRDRFAELEEIVRAVSPHEVHLVLDMTMRAADARATTSAFLELGATKVLLTKADQTAVFGVALNLASEFGVPLSYVCDGQSIPGSIRTADGETLGWLMLGGLLVDDRAECVLPGGGLREETAGPARGQGG